MNAPFAALLGAALGGSVLIATMDLWMDISDRAAAWLIGITVIGSAALGVGLLALCYAKGWA